MTENSDPDFWVSLSEYLSGEDNPEKKALVEAWISDVPERADLVRALRASWEAAKADGEFPVDDGVMWQRIAAQTVETSSTSTDAAEASPSGIPRKPVLPAHRQRSWMLGMSGGDVARYWGSERWPLRRAMWYVLAGAFVGAVCLMVGRWSGARRVNTMLSAQTSTYATGRGEQATVTLPDGSTVLLNVDSRLQVPADYAAGHRTVQLTGEALFTVAHHSSEGFIVKAGPSTTRVLGTSFVVRHYASDTSAVVAVRDGKVLVGTTRHAAVITASEQIVAGPRGLGPVLPADAAVSSFVNGVLILTGVSFPAAIPELDRWYDADIRLGDPQLAAKGVTSEFAAGSLAELTEILEGTFNVRVVRVGRVLTLYAR